MSDPSELALGYLQGAAPTMQLATVHDGKPWIATVYFVTDDELKVYWLSWPERRHSQELAEQVNVAATVVVKQDQPVIGVQFEGIAEEVTDLKTIKEIMKLYVAKYNKGEKFYDAVVSGTNKHHIYKLTPDDISLFDEVTFPGRSPIKL